MSLQYAKFQMGNETERKQFHYSISVEVGIGILILGNILPSVLPKLRKKALVKGYLK